MLPFECVCCVSRCLQEPCDFHEALEDHGQNDNCIVELIFFKLRIERRLDIEISDRQLEMGASSLKVRACHSTLNFLIHSIPYSPWRRHASEGQAACGPLLFLATS